MLQARTTHQTNPAVCLPNVPGFSCAGRANARPASAANRSWAAAPRDSENIDQMRGDYEFVDRLVHAGVEDKIATAFANGPQSQDGLQVA